ncbi:MAG: hypothetical protein BJ554DRAFT_3577 [Olpidium bornovanus]|uniref:Uncharacterized protein n=1 Tax=Olpidium bornovanus TaxID=278681 RepID=A0A8H7ZNY4_9FUNG|nr:MAG: hypothetical protein BJ554DRAFT_3577 [Olpidium bornovanus]
MNTTLELFWDLASLDQGKRLRAAADLVRALHTFQRAHRSGFADSDWDRLVDACAAAARKRRASAGARVEAEPEPDDGGDSVMEDADGGRERSERGATETDGGADCPSGAENVNPAGVSLKKVDFAQLDRLCAPDVSYALKRLLRGLPSSRDGARQGFALALTEVLAFLDFLDVSTVLDLIAQHTEVSSGLKGPEERDMLFGRLFGYTAVVQSGMLARPSTTLAQFQHLVTAAMGCARKKSFLMEGCYRVVGAALCTVGF